jgi:dolichol-phosphate mannosyltransferase
MDADLSHPPESVPAVIAPIAEGRADFCIGSRYTAGGKTKEDWGFLRQINSQVATLLARPLTAAKDPMAGFFCLTRDVLRRAEDAGLNPIGYKIGLEILIKARCRRVAEVPIEFSDRLHGKSKLTLKQQIEYLRHLWRLYLFKWPWAILLGVLVGLGLVAVIYAAVTNR